MLLQTPAYPVQPQHLVLITLL